MLNLLRKLKTDYSDAEKGMLYAPYVTARADKKDVERTFTRLFLTEDGQKVLSYLQLITYHRAASPNATDEQIRHLEGQRTLMTTILRLINNGRA